MEQSAANWTTRYSSRTEPHQRVWYLVPRVCTPRDGPREPVGCFRRWLTEQLHPQVCTEGACKLAPVPIFGVCFRRNPIKWIPTGANASSFFLLWIWVLFSYFTCICVCRGLRAGSSQQAPWLQRNILREGNGRMVHHVGTGLVGCGVPSTLWFGQLCRILG